MVHYLSEKFEVDNVLHGFFSGNDACKAAEFGSVIMESILSLSQDVGPTCSLCDIHFVNHNPSVTKEIEKMFNDHVAAENQRRAVVPPKIYPGTAQRQVELPGKGHQSEQRKTEASLQVYEDCVICMEPVDSSDIKTLPKCRHSFHHDCIDQQFKFKPACPTCGAIYGIITGNQPKSGTMSTQREHGALPGFDGVTHHHMIQYNFPDGTQQVTENVLRVEGGGETSPSMSFSQMIIFQKI